VRVDYRGKLIPLSPPEKIKRKAKDEKYKRQLRKGERLPSSVLTITVYYLAIPLPVFAMPLF